MRPDAVNSVAKRETGKMPRRGLAFLLCAISCCALAQPAIGEMPSRLSQQHFGAISPGDFQAGDHVRFTLGRYRSEYLMRMAGEPEVYVLYADYGSLGGRVLRYDSGAIAIQVAGWGAMTIYPDNQPDGLPAMRTGDAQPPNLPMVNQSQILSAADDEASHLAYVSGVHVNFAADWNALANDAGLRAIAYDTLGNAARGIARFAANPACRDILAQKVATIRLQTGPKLVVQLSGNTLIVTFNPALGYMGRASSRAIAFALGKLFAVPMPN